ncbi:MAG TPA: hypothetical protein ENN29_08075, partial [Candidatus Hydrogenedentes bacterium]|nr:hypothetical protein [Candidatus Hydrogenedentota bacterium]
AMQDDAAVVAVAAARALLQQEDANDDALAILVNGLNVQDEWIRIQAANALDAVGEKARPVVDTLEQAIEEPDNKYVARLACHAVNALLGTNYEAP